MKSKILKLTVTVIACAAIVFFMTGWISAVMSDVDADDSQTSVVESPSVDSVSEPLPVVALPPVPEAEPTTQPAVKPAAQPKTEQPAAEPPAQPVQPVTEPPAQPIAEPPAQPTEPAVQAVTARTVYVYKDYRDASNKYTQPAWMGSNYNNVPPMDDRAEGFDGSTGIEATINFAQHTWGGYFFTVPVFDQGADRPRPGYGDDKGVGLDLSGAQKLTFYAKGIEGGERVEFFTAGLGFGEHSTSKYPDSSRKITLGYVRLTTEWKKYEIDVSKRNMSSIACGFGWASSNAQNGGKAKLRFLFDEVRFEF
jgi:hypothetical protein